MKAIWTIVFLLLSGVQIYLATILTRLTVKSIKGESQTLKVFLIRVGMLLNLFGQFWMLTGLFPGYLVLLLVGAAALGASIYAALGKVSGFTLNKNRQKIGALQVIWGAQQPKLTCALQLLLPLPAIVLGIFGSLWYFWTRPVGDAEAVVMITFFHFVLIQVAGIPYGAFLTWPVVTSEYLDDDVRNAYLAGMFSNIFYQTIILLFPAWLFQTQISEVFGVELPPFWVLLSIPILIFIFVGLLPYCVGLFRHRAQSRAMLDWRSRWLGGLRAVNRLPEGQVKDSAIEERLAELTDEIKTRVSENTLLHFYQNLVKRDSDDVERPPLFEPLIEPPEAEAWELSTPPAGANGADAAQGAVGREAAPQALAAQVSRKPDISAGLKMIRDRIKGQPAPTTAAPDGELAETVKEIIVANQDKLVKWDIRFAHLMALLHLYEVGVEAKTKDIGRYAKAQLKEAKDAVQPKRNFFIAASLSVLNSAIIFLFKTYDAQIIEFIGKLVK